MDVLEVAEGYEAKAREAAIENARRTVSTTKRTGRCGNCSEPVHLPQALFCDADCQADHAERERLKRINGVR